MLSSVLQMPVIKPNEWMDKIRGTLPVPKMPQKKIKVDEKTESSSTESPS